MKFDFGRLIFDRSSEDVRLRTKKGIYNADDLNRAAEAVGYIAFLLDTFGYAVGDTPKADWRVADIPCESDMAAHINAIRGLDVIRYSDTPIDLPNTMARLGYKDANAIEEFLKLIGKATEKIPESWYFCGEINGGEV